MTRAEAINHLKQDGDPKGNIIMLWWNKESFSHHDITNQEWNEVVDRSDEYDFSDATESINSIVHDIRAKAKGVYSE